MKLIFMTFLSPNNSVNTCFTSSFQEAGTKTFLGTTTQNLENTDEGRVWRNKAPTLSEVLIYVTCGDYFE